MAESPRYSFVLPAYKGRYLARAIESILAQTLTDLELVIVNDASPDDLDAIVAAYADPRIRYMRNPANIGGTDLVAQWNRCLSEACGTYVVLASDDDEYHPDYLQEMDTLAREHPEVDVLYPQVRYIDSEGRELRRSVFSRRHMPYLDFVESYCAFQISGGIPQYMYRREALEAIGGFVNFETAWRSDDATLLALARNGVAVSERYLFTFRFSGLNISSVVNDARMMSRKLRADRQLHDFITARVLPAIDAADDPSGRWNGPARQELKQALARYMRTITLTEVKKCDLPTYRAIRGEYLALGYLSAREYKAWLRQLRIWSLKLRIKRLLGR